MKKLILFLCIACAAFAATPVIVVTDENTCLIDGSNAGMPGDAIVNHPALAPAINTALKAYLKSTRDAHAAALKSATDAATAAEAKVAALVTALKSVDQSKLPAEAKAELLTAAEKEKAALQAQKAEVEAKLAALP